MLTLTINGVDYTSKWRLYESSWTMRAWQGESSQSQFILDDDDGSIDHANLAARKIVEVWEDASGDSKCMYRGRVANKTLGMGTLQAPGVAMRWIIFTEDYNVDLKGIEVQGFERGEETDDERVEAVRLEYLNGLASVSPRARQSTNLDGTYIGSDPGDAAPLFDETYTDTDPLGVLTRIVEMTGRVFFVYLDDEGDGELVYFNRADDADDLLSDIEVRDDGEVEGVDDATIFAAYKGPQAGDHGGQTILTGGSVRYQAGGYYRESDIDGRESTYDKWEITLRNDNIRREEAAEDYLEANVDAFEETFTYWATIDMRAEYAHLIRAGMRVRIKRKRANQTVSQRLLVVTSEHAPVKPDADGEAIYRVTLEVGRPTNPHTTRSRFNIPIPDTPNEPPTVTSTRLYYTEISDGSSGISDTDYSGTWTHESLDTDGAHELSLTPQDTYANSGSNQISWDSAGASARTVVLGMFSFPLSGSASILAAVQNGATWRTVIRSANRHGAGISENAQQNFPDWTMRVWRPGTSSFIGTIFDVGDAQAAYRFDPSNAYPSIPMQASGAAVGSAVGTDYLVVDLGGEHVEPAPTGGTGFGYRFSDQSDVGDLAYVVDSVADLNSWLEAVTSSGGGSGGKDEELVGPNENCYAGCGHRHHVIRQRAPTPDDDQDGYPTGTFWIEVDDNDTPTEVIRTYLSVDDTDGAAVWLVQADPTAGSSGSTLTIEEEDASPGGVFDTLKVPNDSLTDNGDGSASLDVALAVHAHDPATPGFHGVLVRRTTDFTSTNSNDSVPDFDDELYDTDAFWDVGDPDRLTIPASADGLMMQFYATGLWATNTDNYVELKMYRNVTRPIDASADEPNLIGLLQLPPATSYNTQPVLITPPVQVATGDEVFITFRTPASETVVDYHEVSLLFGGWIVGSGGASSSLIVREVADTDIDPVAELEFDADDFVVTDEGGGVARVALTGGGGGSSVPTGVLLESGHAVPFTFDEILQESDGSDFLWASE